MQSNTEIQIDPDESIGRQIDRMDRTIQNQQFLIQSLIKSFIKNSNSMSPDDAFKKDLTQINQRYEDINEQIILDTSTFSAYDTAFAQIQNRLNKIETQLNQPDEKEENMDQAEKDLAFENMKVDIECLKEQFTNISGTGENSSSKNTISIIKTAFMSKFKKLKNHFKAYQESTNKAISGLRADLENLEMSGQEYHQEFTRLNSKIQNFQITLNYLRDQMNIPDDQVPNGKNSQLSQEIESINKSIESIQERCVLREDAQDYENKVNSIKEKLAQFPLIAAQQEKCARDILDVQSELVQLKNNQMNTSITIAADYQSKLNTISESQQKSDETLRKTRKVVSNLKSEIEQLKQLSPTQNAVTREIQLEENSENSINNNNSSNNNSNVMNKVKSNIEKLARKSRQNEFKINKNSDEITSIQESIESIKAKLNKNSKSGLQDYDQNEDYSELVREIKGLKKEISTIKSNSNISKSNNYEENQPKNLDSIIQRINQIAGQQEIILSQYNGIVSQVREIKHSLNEIGARIDENEEKKNSDIELINQKMKNLSESVNDSFDNQYVQSRAVSLDMANADDVQQNEGSSLPLQQLTMRIKEIEHNLNALRIRAESEASNQNKLVNQFNELVPQLRQMRDQLVNHILECQQNAAYNRSHDAQADENSGDASIEISIDDDENSNDDQASSKGSSSSILKEINSLKSSVSHLQSKVSKIEKDIGKGELHPFLNQVRTEVNSLEKEIATIKSNTSDVSTSAFKNQSNQITKLQRQVHTLKRNFEKHLILSSNTGVSQDGIQLDDEDDEESENSLSNLIKSNATAGTKMKDSLLDAIEKRVNEMKTENDENNSNLDRKVSELEKKVKKLTSSNRTYGNNFEVSGSDEELSERVKNLESLANNLNSSKDSLAKDNSSIRSTLSKISNKLDDTIKKVNQISKEIGNLNDDQISLTQRSISNSSSPRKALSSPRSDVDSDGIDKKLSQLYVQVNSYYSGMSNLSNSLKSLTKKFEQLRNDVNTLMMKSPKSSKSKVSKTSKSGKNNHNISDIDYNDNEISEDN